MVNIWQSYGQDYSGFLFLTHMVDHVMHLVCAVLVMRVVMAIVIDRVISASHLSCVLQLLM